MSDVWRTGRKVGRTVYIGDELVGVMDTPELAEQVVRAVNIDRMATTTEHDTGCGSCSQHVRVNRLRAELNLISGGWESRVRLREEKDARLAEVQAENVELAGRLEARKLINAQEKEIAVKRLKEAEAAHAAQSRELPPYDEECTWEDPTECPVHRCMHPVEVGSELVLEAAAPSSPTVEPEPVGDVVDGIRDYRLPNGRWASAVIHEYVTRTSPGPVPSEPEPEDGERR